jgi:hypothetical protein
MRFLKRFVAVFWWEASVMGAATIAWVLILKEAAKELCQKLRDLPHHALEKEPRPIATAVPQGTSAGHSEMSVYSKVTEFDFR